MKKLFLLLSAALFLFSCASVQDKAASEYAESVEEEGASADVSAAGEEVAVETEGGQGRALLKDESETTDVSADGLAPEVQRRNPSQRAVPLGRRRPRPLPSAEPRAMSKRAADEAGGAQAETLAAEALSEEESPQALESQVEPPRKPQAAPSFQRRPRTVQRTEPRPSSDMEELSVAPAQAAPLASGQTEAESGEADAEGDALPSVESVSAELPPSVDIDVTEEAEEDVLGEEQPFASQLPYAETAPSAADAAPEPDESAVPEEEPPPLEPSRSVFLSAGQSLEVWYPGGGWVFSGFRESSSPGGMTFSSRRSEGRDTIFSFRALQPGTYILEFSRFDVLTGGYIEDALLAEVLAEDAALGGVVRAPDYGGVRIRALPQGTQEGEEGESVAEGELSDEPSVMVAPAWTAREGPAPSGAPQEDDVFSSEVSSIEEADTPEEVLSPLAAERTPARGLNEVRVMIEEGDIESALSALDSFFAEYAVDTDEALFLLGQAYEADSPRRDMRRALSAYETLTSNYPLSRFWQEADRRIRHIRRFYFDMR